jgi:hypothetical protein
MNNNLLNASPTLKKLLESQECKTDAETGIKLEPEKIGFDRLVSGLGTWIDLVCRCRFYTKTSNTED